MFSKYVYFKLNYFSILALIPIFLRNTFTIATHHVFKTKVVMYIQEISPHLSLANVRVTFHHKIPLRPRSQMGQNVRAEQDYGHKVRRESETKAKLEISSVDLAQNLGRQT
jgi:hypothetical protein